MSNLVIFALGSNSPSPTSGLLIEWSLVYIWLTNIESPIIQISCKVHASYSTTSSRWYILSNSAFAYTKYNIPYFLIGFAVTI